MYCYSQHIACKYCRRLLCTRWLAKKRIQVERVYWSLGREAWTLWRLLELLDWWWPWIFWISPGTRFIVLNMLLPPWSPNYYIWNPYHSFLRTWVLPQSGYSTAVILFRFVKSLTLLGGLLSWWNVPSYSGLSYNDEVDTAAIAPFVKVWFKLSLSSRINFSCSLSMHITMVHHNNECCLLVSYFAVENASLGIKKHYV